MSDNNVEKDDFTGVETTGHEWDGIKELNNPSPRWWLLVLLATIIWAVGYWIVYPAWPTLSGDGERGGTEGTFGWTQYDQLKESQAEIMARRAAYLDRFNTASFEEIKANEELYAFAVAGGASAFKDNCATCHGTGGSGSAGYPNLLDDDWLWGGDVDAIHETIRVGVRGEHDETRYSEMPAFGDMLGTKEISDISDYVLSFTSAGDYDGPGQELYEQQCAACHGMDGRGIRDFGAPNLADAIWFYGGTKGDIMSQIRRPKHGVMPAWETRLDESTIRQLAIYVHSLGGGEE
ncbi:MULTISPECIES: cytochrome-c oxidase, cbb3-type subunit III [Kordiimonas]|jgi:cytochrome c oxidase cbb3-type subunit 3|uniref:Cbb3-type cytochrome c oxidase subunit n=1 Tax=Kordiimonas lacus TaxID=637679 RepID=A0A1G6ZFJ2_9PROT|nr:MULTISPECIES: cytochrome-c oxidase, cbb3-type subunit III [Kordiimonas]SDE01123.1 cytochrome c oxidase cbb3-type subunit 3 [Kordiimonas lacus]